jgi:endonuclease/exonuclease/phosphatase family metal-dependent hydrolase
MTTWRATGWVVGLLMGIAGAMLRAEPLTIATYNIENYTLANRTTEDGVYRKEYPKPEAEKAALRAVIRQMNADVVALQEVGGAAYLRELQRDLKSEGFPYAHAVVLEAADKERMIAVLSRRELTGVTRHTDLTFKYFDGVETVRRGLLEVRVASAAGEVALFVVHLKSRFTEREEDPRAALWRAGEAVAVRDRVLAVFPEPATARFVIAGDFNCGRTDRPVRAMLERGKTTIADWLPAGDSRGHVWSYFYRKEDEYSRVDHVLVSPGLGGRVTGRIHDSAETERASDHRPVVVTIQ